MNDAVANKHATRIGDGWLMLMELDGLSSDAVLRRNTWGLDLAGQAGNVNSLEAAGGIGGLLAVSQSRGDTGEYLFTYDANGNVAQVLDRTATTVNDALVAHYEYDPYGNVTNDLSGYAYAETNRWRFSTKQFDAATGLGYWGYRYYDPVLGRWLSRDPIGALGLVKTNYVWLYGYDSTSSAPSGDGPNDYRNSRNNLVVRIDPEGATSISLPGVGRISPGNWPPGVPYPEVPPGPRVPHVPRDNYDYVSLYCYELLLSGMYHCDVVCTSASGQRLIGGGTGPASSGGYKGPGGNPGWRDKPGPRDGSHYAGGTYADAGTCECLRQKAEKFNQIQGKHYQLPRGSTTSNSNALLSTMLRCCGVSLTPTRTDWVHEGGRLVPKYSDLNTPGWGDSVLYECGTKQVVARDDIEVKTYTVPCYCPVTCETLK